MSFRKPWAFRLGSGMASLSCLAAALYFAFEAVGYFGVWQTWLWNIPMCLLMAGVLANAAGPHDVFIDLDARTCQITFGWPLYPRKRTYSLTKASCVGVCPGGSTYFVFLILGGGTNNQFLLARPERKSDALNAAQEFADKLHLPVKETSLKGLRNLS
jgi:hypothetical protein